jgi:hypothetical protein
MYHTEIKRAENHPVTGKAQYTVTRCIFHEDFKFGHVEARRKVPVCLVPNGAILHTNKPYRVGNLINPRKALGI